MVSALKVGGRRLHELAREGIEVERDARPVTVYRFDVLDVRRDPDGQPVIADRGGVLGRHLRPHARRRPRATCSAPVPTCATCGARRSVPFGIDEAASPDDAELLAPIEAVRALSKVVVGADDAAADRRRRGAGPTGRCRAVGDGHRPTARCSPCTRRTAADRAKPAVVLVTNASE